MTERIAISLDTPLLRAIERERSYITVAGALGWSYGDCPLVDEGSIDVTNISAFFAVPNPPEPPSP